MRWLAEGKVNVDGLAIPVSPRDAQHVYQQLLHQPAGSLTALYDWTTLA
jgi:hypothetical protein